MMRQNNTKNPENLETLREREREQYLTKINKKINEGRKAFIKYIQNADYC